MCIASSTPTNKVRVKVSSCQSELRFLLSIRVFASSCASVYTCAHSCVYKSTYVYIHTVQLALRQLYTHTHTHTHRDRASERGRERERDLGGGIAAGATEDGGVASTGNLGVWPQVQPRGRCSSQGGSEGGQEEEVGRGGRRAVGTGKGGTSEA
jgi:hypothetical protein